MGILSQTLPSVLWSSFPGGLGQATGGGGLDAAAATAAPGGPGVPSGVSEGAGFGPVVESGQAPGRAGSHQAGAGASHACPGVGTGPARAVQDPAATAGQLHTTLQHGECGTAVPLSQAEEGEDMRCIFIIFTSTVYS